MSKNGNANIKPTETTKPQPVTTAITPGPGEMIDGVKAPPVTDMASSGIIDLDPDEIVIIGRDTADGPEHWLYDERAKLAVNPDMARHISVHGVVTDVIVIRMRSKGAKSAQDIYAVNEGRQRVINARAAKLITSCIPNLKVRCRIMAYEGVKSFMLARALNSYRVTDGPLANARNAKQLLDAKIPLDDVLHTFGVQDQTLKYWLRLLSTSAKVRTAVESGRLSGIAGASLADLDHAAQDKALDELLASGEKPTAERARDKAKEATGKAPKLTPKARIAKATDSLRVFADEYAANSTGKYSVDSLLSVIEKLSKQITGKSLAKLAVITP
jgi:hypothetical protein